MVPAEGVGGHGVLGGQVVTEAGGAGGVAGPQVEMFEHQERAVAAGAVAHRARHAHRVGRRQGSQAARLGDEHRQTGGVVELDEPRSGGGVEAPRGVDAAAADGCRPAAANGVALGLAEGLDDGVPRFHGSSRCTTVRAIVEPVRGPVNVRRWLW